MFKEATIIVCILCMGHALNAQPGPVLLGRMSFENDLLVSAGEGIVDARTLQFNGPKRTMTQGIEGQAMDLSGASAIRYPVRVPLSFDHLVSFTVKLWIRTQPGAALINTIASNRSNLADSTVGWSLSAQSTGSWMWAASDGSTGFEYVPTVRRQPINDGRWHQLAFSVDHEGQKVRLYYDGTNVAVYHIGDLGSLTRDRPVSLGGLVSSGQNEMWTFNGIIDEFEIWSGILRDEDIQNEFSIHYPDKELEWPGKPAELKMLAWNIWHGGREHGNQVGVQRVIEVIRDLNPDIICLIETYGSGPQIADALGYFFYLRSSNLSILSKYPFRAFIDIYRPFNCGGVYVDIGSGQDVAVVNTWLNYLPDYRKAMRDDQLPAEEIFLNEGETRYAEIKKILDELAPVIKNTRTTPLILAGDFNSPSHLDFIQKMKEIHWGYVLEWPVTREIEENGLMDSFREIHPDPKMNYGGTQPSEIFDTFHYRIDYIFYRGRKLTPVESRIIRSHPVKFPSDHHAVFTIFKINE